jgi:hypothetical protein
LRREELNIRSHVVVKSEINDSNLMGACEH